MSFHTQIHTERDTETQTQTQTQTRTRTQTQTQTQTRTRTRTQTQTQTQDLGVSLERQIFSVALDDGNPLERIFLPRLGQLVR